MANRKSWIINTSDAALRVFLCSVNLRGWRYVTALERRTKGDFAMMVKKISDTFYPDIERMILVADNLNTHNISSFYEA